MPRTGNQCILALVGLVSEQRFHMDGLLQGTVDGAFVGDLEKALALRVVERAFERDCAAELVDLAVGHVVLSEVRQMNLGVADIDFHILQ